MMRRGIVTAIIVFSLLIPVLTISCDTAQQPEAEALIGPDGGVVEVTNPESEIYGFKLVIPEGALDEEKLITVEIVDEPPSIPYEYQTSPCVEIGPSGTQFAVNCTISLPYDESSLNDYSSENALSIFSYDASCECWIPTDGIVVDTMSNVIHGEVQHLSLFDIFWRMKLHWHSNATVGMTEHKSEYPPILFVHGIASIGLWGNYESAFGETLTVLQGLFSERPVNERLDIWGFSYYTGDYIEYSAGLLSSAIDTVKQETGQDRVLILAHSMGGLVTRAYVEDMAINKSENVPVYYKNDISKILFAGTPHHGSIFALLPALAASPAGAQMLPGSAFLTNLNDKSEHPIPGELLVHNLLGYHDYPDPIPDSDGIVSYESQKLLPEYGDGDLVSIKVTTLVDYFHVYKPIFGLGWSKAEVFVAEGQEDHHQGLETMEEFILDKDLDGSTDSADNCPDTFNPDQADSDGDGIGDVCETPILNWKLDEGSGNSVYDSSGHDNDGTIYGGAQWIDNGDCGSALSFDGYNDYAKIDHFLAPEITDMITVEAWAKIDSAASWQTIVSNAQVAGWSIEYFAGPARFNWAVHINGSYRHCQADAEANLGEWYHLAGTYDGQTARFYVNGVEQSDTETVSGKITSSSHSVQIGANPPGADNPLNGAVDEVRIYRYALTQSQIQADMNECSPSEFTELYYDSGYPSRGWATGPHGGAGVRFTPPTSEWTLTAVNVAAWYRFAEDAGKLFHVEIWDSDLTELFRGAYRYGDYFNDYFAGYGTWSVIDIPDIVVSGDFYVCFFVNAGEGGHYMWTGFEREWPVSHRSYAVRYDTNNIEYAEDWNWTIRAIGHP